MHESVFFNDGLLPDTEPNLPALSAASLFGKGIFTTIAIHDRGAFLWEKHWRRLKNNSTVVGIDLGGFDEDRTRAALDELIAANSVRNGRARITFFDESASTLWSYKAKRRTSLLVTTAEAHPHPADLTLTVSPYAINPVSPLTGVKSCNYLEKMLVLDEARKRGFAEAIQLNERGEVASACMANVFWLKGKRLFTPSMKTGCLAGTTREFVLENLDCDEVEVGIEGLSSANEIFLTSAGLGVAQVARFEGRTLNQEPHPVTDLIPAHR